MCGITGYWDRGGLREEEARVILGAMTEALRHRGPDDAAVWIDGASGIALGFRRLSIIDLSPSGRQPMESATGRYVVVFNGEIYNFGDLRRDLVALGHRFRGRSDTEVLLAAISAWGLPDALRRFNGMFALALWDRERRTLSLARDRAGEKPLYYGWAGGTLLFGSELKALRAHPAFPAELDVGALALYFRRGCIPGPYTVYRALRKLPPGTLLEIGPGTGAPDARPVPYWSAREVAEAGIADPLRGSSEDAVRELDALLRDAVRMRMEADVPLGAFLSGGVDSSTVVAMMQAQSDRPVRTFTIGFWEARYNEAGHAAAVARHLGTEHTEMYVTPQDALAVIPRLPTLYDEPFADTSQVPTFLLSQLTRRHVTVSLSGDAGDELFGGYRRYQLGARLWRGIRAVPRPVRDALAAALQPSDRPAGRLSGAIQRLVRPWTGKRSLRERRRQAAEMLRLDSPAHAYDYMMSRWKSPALLLPEVAEPPVSATDPALWPALGGSTERLFMYLDLVSYLPDDILAKVDRASMGVSLEARIPLLDHRVIALAWRLPPALTHRDGQRKWVLRRVLDRYVPRALVDRPKQGFGLPIGQWLRGPLRDWAEGHLDERRLRADGILEAAPIRKKWREHLGGGTRWDDHLWTVLMFQAWREEALGRASRGTGVAVAHQVATA